MVAPPVAPVAPKGGAVPRSVISGLLWAGLSAAVLASAVPSRAAGTSGDFTRDRPFEACLEDSAGLAAGTALLDVVSRGRDGLASRSRARLSWSGGADETHLRLQMLEPAELAGSALLLVERPGEPAEAWAWLPEIRKRRRVGGRHLGQPLFGTNLRYDDLERIRRVVGDEGPDAWSESDYEGRPVWKLLKRDGRDTVVTWLDRERCVPLRTEVSDERGRLSRWVQVSQQSAHVALHGPSAFVPRFVVVHDVDGATETRVEVTSVDLSSPPARAVFDPALLGGGDPTEPSPGS